MKKNVEYVTVQKEVVKWEAYDGTIFSDENECALYERTAKCAINGAFEKIPQTEICAEYLYDGIGSLSYDDRLHAVFIEDVNTLEIVNRWIEQNYGGVSKLSAKDIGTVLLYDTYDTDVWLIGTPEEYKKKFCDFIDNNLVNPLMKKIEEVKNAKEEN